MNNAGMIMLATCHLENTIMHTRLDIEDNIGEGIHLHYRNFRLDYTIKDFLSFASAVEQSLQMLQSIESETKG
jgi:hypothetical protein